MRGYRIRLCSLGLCVGALASAGCGQFLPTASEESEKASSLALSAAKCEGETGSTSPARLTRSQIINSVADTFGVPSSSLTSTVLPETVSVSGGFNNQADLQSFSTTDMIALVKAFESWATLISTSYLGRASFCSSGSSDVVCARQLIERHSSLLFRRVTDATEVFLLHTVYLSSKETTFNGKMRDVVQAMLLSPRFLLHTISQASLDQFALVERLAFLLWDSVPDQSLLNKAKNGELNTDAALKTTINEMVQNSKASRLSREFINQWLRLPASGSSPVVDLLRTETLAFFDHIRLGRAPLFDLIDGKYTFLNAELASHYGIPGVSSQVPIKYEFSPNDPRQGILTNGSVLATSAGGQITSPSNRGVYVFVNFLCSYPVEPPNDVPIISEDEFNANMSIREIMNRHLNNPSCAGCHTLFDPYGFPLEVFDEFGKVRTHYASGAPIEAYAELRNGSRINGPTEMGHYLSRNFKSRSCLVEKVSSYMLKRNLNPGDKCETEKIASLALSQKFTFTDLIVALVKSPLGSGN